MSEGQDDDDGDKKVRVVSVDYPGIVGDHVLITVVTGDPFESI